MITTEKFLIAMGDYLRVPVISDQIKYGTNCETFLIEMRKYFEYTKKNEGRRDLKTLIQQADAGIGKTIAYMVAGMKESVISGLPLIIATSTITNRDQIRDDYNTIVEFARRIGDPIGKLPFINYRSVRDYASLPRAEAIRERLSKTNMAASVIRELDEVIEKLREPGPLHTKLLDAVLPDDITFRGKVIVPRHNLALHGDDTMPDYFAEGREFDKAAIEQPAVIVITHAMLSYSMAFRDLIYHGDVAAVVIDEVDRLNSLDFVNRMSLSLGEVQQLITQLKDFGLATGTVSGNMKRLTAAVAALRPYTRGRDYVMVTHEKVTAERVKDVIDNLNQVAEDLANLGEEFDKREFEGSDWQSELQHRKVAYNIDQVIGAAFLLVKAYQPPFGSDQMRIAEDTDFEIYAQWSSQGAELRGVTASPGRLLMWLFWSPVPVILTTAFLGLEERQFAAQIGLPWKNRHRLSGEIRPYRFGSLKYLYFSNLSNPVENGEPTEQHFDDASRIIRTRYETGERMLVLTPGYHDIEQIVKRLGKINVPLYIHHRGSNITELRQQLVDKPGILLTVYWEGFNIVQKNRRDKRRGVVDKLVMTRLPYSPPNELMIDLYTHVYGERYKKAGGWVFRKNQTEVTRRVHQGFMRLVRGPFDGGTVIICDARFPPPPVLIDQYPTMQAMRGHEALIEAIPRRFRNNPDNFTVEEL